MIDYLVVGLGLAGTSFCETLRRNNMTFKVFNDRSQTSSRVAGGLYNPVILKRFTLSWKADQQLSIALDFYKQLERFLEIPFREELDVLRKFASIEEQNLWFEAADKVQLKPYLDTRLVPNKNPGLKIPYGFGKVLHTGKVDTEALLDGFTEWLKKENRIDSTAFEYKKLDIYPEYVSYNGLRAKHIVFAEGFGLRQNPFFNYLPLQGSKGEYLIIEAKDLKERSIIKASFFIIPLGGDLYKVGATYHRTEKNNGITPEAKNEIIKKLGSVLDGPFKVVDQVGGVRPTVSDRRPLVGRHPQYSNLWVLNGFGSHGILIGPWASEALFNHIESGIPLLDEMDIKRFTKV